MPPPPCNACNKPHAKAAPEHFSCCPKIAILRHNEVVTAIHNYIEAAGGTNIVREREVGTGQARIDLWFKNPAADHHLNAGPTTMGPLPWHGHHRSHKGAIMGGALAILTVGAHMTSALDNGAAVTPPMGWRSWNCFQQAVNDTVIRAVVDAMSAKSRMVNGTAMSLIDVGFQHIGVDDGWQACGTGRSINNKSSFHAPDGTPLVNHSIFPDLKDMVSYGHSKGAKMGWYDNNCICMDSYTLAMDPTWAEKSFAGDVQLLLDADFDSVKIDNCGDDMAKGFTSRSKHINESGKVMMIENANQGFGNPQRGPCKGNMQCPGPNSRGNPNNTLAPGWCPFNLFRTGGDIRPNFDGVMGRLQAVLPYLDHTNPVSRPDCWAYPDMLEVGNFNEANSTLGFIESRSHFGGWIIVSAPLILSLDVTNKALIDSVWPIISNLEAIAVNQAWDGHPGRLVTEVGPPYPGTPDSKAVQVWAKAMPVDKVARKGAGQAVLVINRGTTTVDVTLDLSVLGISGIVNVRDVWAQRDMGFMHGNLTIIGLASHDSKFVRFYSPTM